MMAVRVQQQGVAVDEVFVTAGRMDPLVPGDLVFAKMSNTNAQTDFRSPG